MKTTIILEEAWDKLIDLGVSEDTLITVTNINGYSLESLEDILYSEFGYHNFDQFEDEEN